MSGSEAVAWSRAKMDWTPEGYRLVLLLPSAFGERHLAAGEQGIVDRINDVVPDYTTVTFELAEEQVMGAPDQWTLVIVSEELFDAPPHELRRAIEDGVQQAHRRVVANLERETKIGRAWFDELTGRHGDDTPTA